MVLPVPVAVLRVVFAVEFPVPVWARTPPDDFETTAEAVGEESEPEPELELPSQVPLLLMLCQLPVKSVYVYFPPQPKSLIVTLATSIVQVSVPKVAGPPAHSHVPLVAGAAAAAALAHPTQLPIFIRIGVCG